MLTTSTDGTGRWPRLFQEEQLDHRHHARQRRQHVEDFTKRAEVVVRGVDEQRADGCPGQPHHRVDGRDLPQVLPAVVVGVDHGERRAFQPPHLGFGRIVALGIEAPNMLVNMVCGG